MSEVLERLRALEAVAETDQPFGYVKDIFRCAADEIERLSKIETAAKTVLETFRKDEAAGYHTRDRQFAIDLLGKYIDEKPQS